MLTMLYEKLDESFMEDWMKISNVYVLCAIISLVMSGLSMNAQTFYNARDLTTNNMYENALHAHTLHYKSDADYWLNYLTGFVYQCSNSENFGALFMPVNAPCVSVRQDGTGDVNSGWFDLDSNVGNGFVGSLCIKPKRKVYAMLNQFHLCLDPYICGLWFEVNFAYEHVNQETGCLPSTKNAIGANTELKNMTEAGLCCDTFKETAVNDVELKGGWDYVFTNHDYVGIYIIGTAPTKKHQVPVNTCFFKPWIGTNHGSCGFGFKGGHTLWSCDDRAVRLMTDMKYRYVFSADEIRVFDLEKNGAWSRYLLLAEYATPAKSFHDITLFTQKVSVTPRSVVDWWTGVHATCGDVGLELGYDLWWRATERITGINNELLPRKIGIYDIAGTTKVSASTATIAQGAGPQNKAVSDSTFTGLSSNNLDLNSAAQQAALSQTFYIAASWSSKIVDCPAMVGLGGSYELASRNNNVKTTMDQWSIFVDASVNF